MKIVDLHGRILSLIISLLLGFLGTDAHAARNYIDIVGSSTLYPFTTVVAERFGRSTPYRVPMVRPTGTGSGFKDFCQGIGAQYVDINNASRAIKKSERELCARNGVTDILELMVGYDGIVLASSKQSPELDLSLRQLFQALAQTVEINGELVPNPYQKWSDIDPSLPQGKIEVLGPPPTSGTRDAFVELGMQVGCKSFPALKQANKTNPDVCHHMREDGAFIEGGENDNFILRKLVSNPNAVGIFGFSFLEQNRDLVRPVTIRQVQPTMLHITSGQYPLTRPLFLYVKKLHIPVVPGLAEFLAEFTSNKAWGTGGYLSAKGLIVLPQAQRQRSNQQLLALLPAASR